MPGLVRSALALALSGLAGACFVTAEGQGPSAEPCATVEDCPPSSEPCRVAACSEGLCLPTPRPDGPANVVPGNCSLETCTGGEVSVTPDPADVQDDGEPCTRDECDGPNPVHIPSADGDRCAIGSSVGACQGGVCIVACNQPSDCTPGPCRTASCLANVCYFQAHTGAPLEAVDDPVGDCMTKVCDAGTLVGVLDDADLPMEDGDLCTVEGCDMGVVQHLPVACTAPAVCELGTCILAQGQACPGVAPCGAGLFCVDGFCCNSLCNQLCGSCRGADTMAPDGVCAPIADSDPIDECAGTLVCCGFVECGTLPCS
jgi:hypothetical protein